MAGSRQTMAWSRQIMAQPRQSRQILMELRQIETKLDILPRSQCDLDKLFCVTENFSWGNGALTKHFPPKANLCMCNARQSSVRPGRTADITIHSCRQRELPPITTLPHTKRMITFYREWIVPWWSKTMISTAAVSPSRCTVQDRCQLSMIRICQTGLNTPNTCSIMISKGFGGSIPIWYAQIMLY